PGRCRRLGTGREVLLGQLVLERVVAHHDNPSPDFQRVHRRRQGSVQDIELLVDLDAKGLEGALGRVSARPCSGCRDDASDALHQLPRGRERLTRAVPDYGGCNTARELLLAPRADDAYELGFVVFVYDISGCRASGRIHPHVQGRVERIGETALAFVKLKGGDPQVEEDPVYAIEPEIGDDVTHLVVDGVDQVGPAGERRQPFPGKGERLFIAVQADQVQTVKAAQERFGVPTHAEGAVHDDGPFALVDPCLDRRRQQPYTTFEQHGNVPLGCGTGRVVVGHALSPFSVSQLAIVV